MKTRIKTYGLKRFQIIGLLLFLWVAVFHNQICYDKPLEASVKSSSSSFLPPLIPYAASSFDKANRNVGPFDQQQVSSWYYRHWLGTNALGKDVLAGLINGSYIALKVGFWTGLFSLIIGVFFGYLSGYFGDSGLRVNKLTLFLSLILSAVLIFYAVYTVGIIRVACLITIVLVMFLGLSNQRGVRKKLMPIPVDLCVQKTLEIFKAIPNVFIILVLLAMFKEASINNVILVVTIILWPAITRHLRAEILKLKEEQFILSAKAIGQKNWKIFINYILPLSMSPLAILLAFGFSSAILIESTLSFLGIGMPLDQVTWGGMLQEARFNFKAWWLAIFPGLMIYFIIFLFNSIGDSLSDCFQKASGSSASSDI